MVFNITKKDREVFGYVSTAAEDLNYPAYVVGGYVRDRLLGRPSKDMDIVCVGDGIELAVENVIVGIVANMVFMFIVLKTSGKIEKAIGPNGIAIIRKIFGVILLAIAVKLFTGNIKLLLA